MMAKRIFFNKLGMQIRWSAFNDLRSFKNFGENERNYYAHNQESIG
jgi:hypothetical protein